MIEFLKTFAIAVVPAGITALLSYLAATKNSAVQIKAIQEQNKADIAKIVQQNKVDIEALKEKHQLEMEAKEKEYQHQIDMVNLKYEKEVKMNEENMQNQLATNVLGSFLGGVFAHEGPVSKKINEAITKGLKDAMKEE